MRRRRNYALQLFTHYKDVSSEFCLLNYGAGVNLHIQDPVSTSAPTDQGHGDQNCTKRNSE